MSVLCRLAGMLRCFGWILLNNNEGYLRKTKEFLNYARRLVIFEDDDTDAAGDLEVESAAGDWERNANIRFQLLEILGLVHTHNSQRSTCTTSLSAYLASS